MKVPVALALLAMAIMARADELPVIESYRPTEPSGSQEVLIRPSGRPGPTTRVREINFGIGEAEPAHRFGRGLARTGYTPGQAQAEIWRAAWRAYPHDRFFARCWAQEAEGAYNQTLRAR